MTNHFVAFNFDPSPIQKLKKLLDSNFRIEDLFCSDRRVLLTTTTTYFSALTAALDSLPLGVISDRSLNHLLSDPSLRGNKSMYDAVDPRRMITPHATRRRRARPRFSLKAGSHSLESQTFFDSS